MEKLFFLNKFAKRSESGWGVPGGVVVENLPANEGDARDVGSIPGLGKSPGGGNGNLLQYSCLENSMDKGVWRATVHGVAKSRTRLSTYAHRIQKGLEIKANRHRGLTGGEVPAE